MSRLESFTSWGGEGVKCLAFDLTLDQSPIPGWIIFILVVVALLRAFTLATAWLWRSAAALLATFVLLGMAGWPGFHGDTWPVRARDLTERVSSFLTGDKPDLDWILHGDAP